MIANHNKLRAIASASAFATIFAVAVGCSSTDESSTAPTETRRHDQLSRISVAEEYYYILQGAVVADPGVAHDPDVGQYFDQNGHVKSFSEIAGPGNKSVSNFPVFNQQMRKFMGKHGAKPIG